MCLCSYKKNLIISYKKNLISSYKKKRLFQSGDQLMEYCFFAGKQHDKRFEYLKNERDHQPNTWVGHGVLYKWVYAIKYTHIGGYFPNFWAAHPRQN